MKSPMVTNAPYITDKENYSDMRVMKSGAGFYIGTIHNDPDFGEEPGSRDSDYFSTKEEAESFLASVESGNAGAIAMLRMTP
jgi:hypothetical protein